MAHPDLRPRLKVVLIEDSLLVRQTMGAVLGEMEGLEVVGGAADETAAIELLLRQQPDLAIVDLELRSGSGLGVLRALAREPERFGRPRTVIFSHHSHALLRERCQALGAERFFDKATQLAELIAYVRQVLPS
jgi:DNA-binding NarL/FixJ family response regulator